MPLLVAAIDFGTTYSGWAFSFKHEFENNPTQCSAKNWMGGQLVSLKGPTCLLVKPDGKTIHSFGYDAESKYGELAADEEHTDWFYFRRFKMKLFSPEGIQRGTMLEDESGNKKLPAKNVFALSIKYLKDDLIGVSENRITGGGVMNSDIHWVLTVPAIWDDAAKQFMREAARDAGIADDKLTIALEPEAASLYCRHLPVEQSGKGQMSLASFGPGKRYLVLDAGGGTVDITVHEVLAGAQLKELHKASGGAWGGTQVDLAFEKFLATLVGPTLFEEFKQKKMEDYIDMFRDFEVKKRTIGPDKDSKVRIRIPQALARIVELRKEKPIEDVVKLSKFASKAKVTGDKLIVDQSVAREFFEPSINSILIHMKALLRESSCKGLDAIVMVGGFSESPLLQDAVHKSFKQLKVITPNEAGLAVLKGAVIYGHKPASITARVSKYTYGTDVSLDFDDDEHPFHRKELCRDGVYRCIGIFSTLVKSGQTLEIGKTQDEQTYTTVYDDQTSMSMNIYAARNTTPEFIDEEGCNKIGHFSIPVSGYGKDRKVKVRMIFGGTEIDVECKDEAAGTVSHLKVDFLS